MCFKRKDNLEDKVKLKKTPQNPLALRLLREDLKLSVT